MLLHFTPKTGYFTPLLLTGVLVALFLIEPYQSRAQTPPLPMPFWQSFFARPTALQSPPSNPTTKSKISLGQELFYDGGLSSDGKASCATCHQVEFGYSDGGKSARPQDNRPMARDTPTLWNIGWAKRLLWDASAVTLEAQAFQPIGSIHEMAANWTDILKYLSHNEQYRNAFAKAFPNSSEPNKQNTVKALAAFQRSLRSPITRFDRWIDGDTNALTKSERDGFFLFVGKAGCVGCHAGWRFTDDALYDIGLSATGTNQRQRFKTPTLRMLDLTAPYMHDGRFASLDDVLAHYLDQAHLRPGVSEKIRRQNALTERQRADLVNFLKTLSTPNTPR
ncbi:MAG: cytochrome-c peroxidase [Hyphomicrobiaceae bacterium]